MENKEIWKSIVGYEGCYEVSNFGNIRTLKRSVNTTKGKGFRFVMPREIKLVCRSKKVNYLFFTPSVNNKKSNIFAHRAVADAFIPNPKNLDQVNHINGNKLDNRVENLEWSSALENTIHHRVKLNSSSIYTGVSKGYKRWQATIGYKKGRIHIGTFDTEEEASVAYKNKLIELGKETKYGIFA